jgi:hypothetical protein
MINRITIALALSLLTLLAGCSKGSKLVGTWISTQDKMSVESTYNADGTATAKLAVPQLQGAKVVIAGTWKEDGEKLRVAVTGVTLQDLPPALKAQETAIVDSVKKNLGVGTEKIETIKWVSDTSFTSTDDKGQSVTFTKKA